MALPTSFLVFRRKRPPMVEWVGAWLDQHYGRRDGLPRREVIEGIFAEMPFDYYPTDLRVLHRMWLMARLRDTVARSLGLVFTDGQGGSRWDIQLALPFEDFLSYQVGKLRGANRDIERCRREVEEYSAANGLGLDVTATVEDIKRAAGF